MMTQCRRNKQRGYAMVIAISVVALLSMLGFIALDVVTGELEGAAAGRQAENALYIAEAGVEWMLDKLSVCYSPDSTEGTIASDFKNLFEAPLRCGLDTKLVEDSNDPGCPNAACNVLQITSPKWYRVGLAQGKDGINTGKEFADGEFFVYIAKDTDDYDTILVRVIGRVFGNIDVHKAERVIEVAVEFTGGSATP